MRRSSPRQLPQVEGVGLRLPGFRNSGVGRIEVEALLQLRLQVFQLGTPQAGAVTKVDVYGS